MRTAAFTITPDAIFHCRRAQKCPITGITSTPSTARARSTKKTLSAKEDFKDDFKPYSEEELRNLSENAEHLYKNTSCAILGSFFKGGLGDFGALPAFWAKTVKGIITYT